MVNRYIGRQPIVNERGGLYAYDLSYPVASGDDQYATSSLINNLQNVFGTDRVLGKRIGFIRIDHRFIFDELIDLLPKERIVFMFLETARVDSALIDRVLRLHEEGYRFGINDCLFSQTILERFAPLLPYIEFLKIDMIRSGRIKREDVAKLHELSIIPIASKIESHDMHAECRNRGFDYFQGFFISKPRTLEKVSFSVEQEGIMRLWNLLRADSSIDELVREFEISHLVSLKLLRFVNSAAFSLRSPVSSIRHVLTLLGREPLMRWLMLMLFSEAQHSQDNRLPLLLMVVNRTELMVSLLALIAPKATKEENATAYFIGMLSLIHLIFSMPHREILRKLNVEPHIERALFEGDGYFGELLTAVRAIEMLDIEGIELFLKRHMLQYDVLEPVIAKAMEKVNQFDQEME